MPKKLKITFSKTLIDYTCLSERENFSGSAKGKCIKGHPKRERIWYTNWYIFIFIQININILVHYLHLCSASFTLDCCAMVLFFICLTPVRPCVYLCLHMYSYIKTLLPALIEDYENNLELCDLCQIKHPKSCGSSPSGLKSPFYCRESC